MWRASAYEHSQSTLLEFAKKFNSIPTHPNLYCCPIIEETMLNDGYFLDVTNERILAFDWEIRVRTPSFKPGEFRYSTLTVFERKLRPEKKTQLIIQCDSQKLYIAVAWKEDFMKSDVFKQDVVADGGMQRAAERRETRDFKVFELNDLTQFKDMLSRALGTSQYNHTVFQ